MANAYKVLGRKQADATTEETLYTVPAATEAIVSTITVANLTAVDKTFRLAVKPASTSTLALEHYIAYDITVGASDTTALTLGLALATGNSISVYASAATSVVFTAFGSEIS
jgi:bifunctional ADP-heptose synthase (sugar kinase/adenylyltransferase)